VRAAGSRRGLLVLGWALGWALALVGCDFSGSGSSTEGSSPDAARELQEDLERTQEGIGAVQSDLNALKHEDRDQDAKLDRAEQLMDEAERMADEQGLPR
jgi:hypothetical protein